MDKKNLKVLTLGAVGGFVFGGYCTLKTCFKIKQIRQGFVNAIADKLINLTFDEKLVGKGADYINSYQAVKKKI